MAQILLAAMDLSPARHWKAPPHWDQIDVIDCHTGGEPFRIVLDGLPEIPGETVLQRRRFAQENLDRYRTILMWEPRGHADMYGGIIGRPTRADSDLSVLFLHNEGFSTMCGHGIVALTAVVLNTGILASTGDETTLKIDTPAGQITSTAATSDGLVSEVRFENVPSFVDSLDNLVDVPGMGSVQYDLAFGGAYYAYVDVGSLAMAWPPSGQAELVDAGRRIKKAIANSREIKHPEQPDLGFLYGVIFTGPPQDVTNDIRNVCVFADGEIDRSPTGTGVSGRAAIESARGRLEHGRVLRVESIVGSVFTGRVLKDCEYAGKPAVIPEITGSAFITGRTTFYVDPTDPMGSGFLIR